MASCVHVGAGEKSPTKPIVSDRICFVPTRGLAGASHERAARGQQRQSKANRRCTRHRDGEFCCCGRGGPPRRLVRGRPSQRKESCARSSRSDAHTKTVKSPNPPFNRLRGKCHERKSVMHGRWMPQTYTQSPRPRHACCVSTCQMCIAYAARSDEAQTHIYEITAMSNMGENIRSAHTQQQQRI